jgi:hypothetical protein
MGGRDDKRVKPWGERIKGWGWSVVGFLFFIAIFFVAILFIHGGVWLADKILPLLAPISLLVLIFSILVLVPLGLFRKTRNFAGSCLYLVSFVFGITVWLEGLLDTYVLWGPFGVIVGLGLLGVGVVPVAMVLTLIKGMWPDLVELVVLVALTFGSRGLGLYFASKCQ